MSLVKNAAKEFSAGNYTVAAEMFSQLAKKFGNKNFSANIQLCQIYNLRKNQQFQNFSSLENFALKAYKSQPNLCFSYFKNDQNLDAKKSKYVEAFEKILEEASAIPESNGSEYFAKHDLRVGVIGDIYMYNFYKDVFREIYYLSPENYKEHLTKDLDLVIYTTCWKGINNEEWRGATFREKPQKALNEIIEISRKNNVKTVFQSIEDPSNFEYFLPLAKKFDYVLTTDIDCIESYKKQLGHSNVFFGEYGVNPQFNNPIGSRRNIRNAAFFAGSYPKRYKERCDDMEIIFDSIISSGGELLIADRNYGSTSEDLIYPDQFQSSVLPPVQHNILQKVHKLFRYNLNFNSIKHSPSMCAMRIYELQAQGNGIISNYANSVFNKFPGIRIIPFKQNMHFDFEKNESWEEYRQNMSNIREVFNNKTSYQIVDILLKNIGIKKTTSTNYSKIAVFCKRKTSKIKSAFNCQLYSNKILLEESEIHDWHATKTEQEIGYFCWFSEENNYEENYLNDLLNAFKYTNCQYITKNGFFSSDGQYVPGAEHEYTKKCSGKSRSLFSTKYITPELIKNYEESESFELENGYSIDPFELNFTDFMHRKKVKDHCYRLSVIVPVYNNGEFLIKKCIPSLQRNKLWSEMEILLIDDGSTDLNTLNKLDFLRKIYPNVRVQLNHDAGSGSASRPRNQGIEIASSPLVTFLDPDNEIAPGAYDTLMSLYHEANASSTESIDFVSGFHVKVAENVSTLGRHTSKRLSIVSSFRKDYFDKGRFPVIATQSAIISRQFLNFKKIRFVEKSAGQDTLFGWELIAKSRNGAFSGEPYIIYYAERTDSITNKIDKSYFEKKLILEIKQSAFLKQESLFEKFREHHFDAFMNNWYLKKLELIKNKKEKRASILILEKICTLYEKNIADFL